MRGIYCSDSAGPWISRVSKISMHLLCRQACLQVPPLWRFLNRKWCRGVTVTAIKSFVVIWLPKTRSTKVFSLIIILSSLRPCTPGHPRIRDLLHSGEFTIPPESLFHWPEKNPKINFIVQDRGPLLPRTFKAIMNPNHEQQIGAYVNSLTPATNLTLASANSKNSSPRLPSAEEASLCLPWIFERPNLFIAFLGE